MTIFNYPSEYLFISFGRSNKLMSMQNGVQLANETLCQLNNTKVMEGIHENRKSDVLIETNIQI